MEELNKEVVEKFYDWNTKSDPDNTREYLHDQVELFWNSSKGFRKLNKTQIMDLICNIKTEYKQVRTEISHLVVENDRAAVRLTYFVEPFETPDEETPLVHFMAIWEMKDGKLYRGYEMSYLADEDPDNMMSFSRLPQWELN